MKMKKILALTTINNTAPLKEAIEDITREYGKIVAVRKVYLEEYENPQVDLKPLVEEIESSDVIFVDIRGDVRVGRELPRLLEGKDKTVVVLVGASQEILRLTKMGKFKGDRIFRGPEREFSVHAYVRAKRFSKLTEVLGKILPVGAMKDMRNWVLATRYYAEGDKENIKNLILFILREYCGMREIKDIRPPTDFSYSLYLPHRGFLKNKRQYKNLIGYDPQRPTVAVLMYGGMHFEDCKVIAEPLYEKLKDKVNFFFVVSRVENNIRALKEYLSDERLDLLLNLQYFRIHGGPYGGEPEPTYELLRSFDVPVLIGLKSYATDVRKWKESKEGLTPLEVILGVTLPELDGCIEPLMVASLESREDPEFGRVKKYIALDDRIEKLSKRIMKWISLRRKNNAEKRIAIITYNYPPGEENLGSAGYLDVFESMRYFLEKLRERGYRVRIPDTDMREFFISNGLVNSPNYIRAGGVRLSAQKYARWFVELNDDVRKKVIRYWGEPPGNIMVDGDEIIISGAFLGNVFVGVQPSRGVHEDPEKAYHDKEIPPHHQYIAFYMFLQKEFQADAIVHFGMHGTLEFMEGKEVALSSECFPDVLIGDIPNVYYYWVGNTSESTIAKRRSYSLCISHASPPMTTSGLYERYLALEELVRQYDESGDEDVLRMIREVAEELRMPQEVSEIKKELRRMRRRLIPHGLHVMDRIPKDEELVDYLLGVLRIEREFPSILKMVGEHENVTDEREIEERSKNIIRDVLTSKPPLWLPAGYAELIKDIVGRVKGSSESEGLLRALEGRYIMPARGGDPIKDPDVHPTGRAMYGFDPRAIPTVIAEKRGEKAAELLLGSHLRKHGRYPESVGVVLWGFETMKTGGDTIGLILSLLGVKLTHRKNPWLKDIEIIPVEKLGRPRIDVAITICGIFRDTFGSLIELIERAIRMVSQLDEPPDLNYVRKHYLELKDRLGEFALARFFGPSPTEYATSVRTLIETGVWKMEDEIVRNYDESMCYVYFGTRCEKRHDVFSEVLSRVELVTQERDNVDYDLVDLDHYYEFLGGLSKSVSEKRGVDVDVLVVDTTEEEVTTDTLEDAIKISVRTRLFNPRWIEGMLAHRFHGGKKIKDRFENLLGFSATTGKVENWIFDEAANRYIFDEEMRKRLFENNPYATLRICQILVEAEKRGYWKTDPSRIEKLNEIILSLEGHLE